MYFIFDGKIRIIRVRKNGLKYVKMRLTNKYRKLLNVILSCLWSPYVIGQTIIFSSCFFLLLLLLYGRPM